MQRLGLKSQAEWRNYCQSGNKPHDIPTKPYRTYANEGWVGLGDWLGTGTVANQFRQFRPFKEARAFARGLGLVSNKEWRDYLNSNMKPDDIPSAPEHAYAEVGWAGYPDWLGYARKH